MLALPVGWALADHIPGHITVPGGDVVNFALDQAATVTDIALLDPPPRFDRLAVHNAPEQLVEGHTVFLTLNIPLVRNVTNWTAEIVGNVSCELHSETEGEFGPLGIPLPRRINEFHEECHVAGHTFVTPDPFIDSQRNSFQTVSPLSATGTRTPFVAPNGEAGELVEYEFYVMTTDWYGDKTYQHYYAWGAPVLTPWMHSDGREKSLYVPLPEARLAEMGIERFTILHESEIDPALLPQDG